MKKLIALCVSVLFLFQATHAYAGFESGWNAGKWTGITTYIFSDTTTVYSDGSWASEAIPIWQAPSDDALTIVQVNAAVVGSGTPTLAYNIEERAWASLATAGTDVFAADVTADADGLESTSFSNASMAAKAHMVLTTGSSPDSGTVDAITVTIYYKREDVS